MSNIVKEIIFYYNYNMEHDVKILVKRWGAIGDVILVTGIVRELYKQYLGHCKITVETKFTEVFKNNPYVMSAVVWGEANTNNFDLVINLDNAYELYPTKNMIDSMFYRVFGDARHGLDQTPELYPSQADRDFVDQDLAELNSPFFIMHMRQWHWPAKNIHPSVWQAITTRIWANRTDHKLITVGGSSDLQWHHPLVFNGNSRYTIQQLAYLSGRSKCFVGVDSAPFWAATTGNANIIGLFTYHRPEYVAPINYTRFIGIHSLVECAGCIDQQTAPITDIVCKHGDYRCTAWWDTDRVADIILEKLAS